jgi:hypothetical protein
MSEITAGMYWWVRHVDETGMSGTGRVAQVAVFSDGSAVLRWLKDRNAAEVQSTVFYESVDDLVRVHGHGEKKTGSLVRYLRIGDTCMVNCIDGFGGPAQVSEP